MDGLLNNAQTTIATWGGIIAVIAIVVLGIRLLWKRDVREAVSGVGAVALGCILIGGAVSIAAALKGIGSNL